MAGVTVMDGRGEPAVDDVVRAASRAASPGAPQGPLVALELTPERREQRAAVPDGHHQGVALEELDPDGPGVRGSAEPAPCRPPGTARCRRCRRRATRRAAAPRRAGRATGSRRTPGPADRRPREAAPPRSGSHASRDSPVRRRTNSVPMPLAPPARRRRSAAVAGRPDHRPAAPALPRPSALTAASLRAPVRCAPAPGTYMPATTSGRPIPLPRRLYPLTHPRNGAPTGDERPGVVGGARCPCPAGRWPRRPA